MLQSSAAEGPQFLTFPSYGVRDGSSVEWLSDLNGLLDGQEWEFSMPEQWKISNCVRICPVQVKYFKR